MSVFGLKSGYTDNIYFIPAPNPIISQYAIKCVLMLLKNWDELRADLGDPLNLTRNKQKNYFLSNCAGRIVENFILT